MIINNNYLQICEKKDFLHMNSTSTPPNNICTGYIDGGGNEISFPINAIAGETYPGLEPINVDPSAAGFDPTTIEQLQFFSGDLNFADYSSLKDVRISSEDWTGEISAPQVERILIDKDITIGKNSFSTSLKSIEMTREVKLLSSDIDFYGWFSISNFPSLEEIIVYDQLDGLGWWVYDKALYFDRTFICLPATLDTLNIGDWYYVRTCNEIFFKYSPNIKHLNISSYITNYYKIDNSSNYDRDYYDALINLEDINVDEDNSDFSSYDGCLYNKSRRILLRVPRKKTSITLPSGLVSLSGNCCYRSGITSINLPSSVVQIWAEAFYGCSNLVEVTCDDPSSITSVNSSIFKNCSSLRSIPLLTGISRVPYQTFYGCSSLPEATIPSNITEIGDQAFYGCVSLSRIYLPDKDPSNLTLGTDVFYMHPSNFTIYVPSSRLNDYKNATNWSEWAIYMVAYNPS